ncbi:DUF982 domain-containing protein [Sinorhizobium meliloti]|uniref:DUF982 domain-containing protein n=1 Tax=Rhizobium meliloti TaxID=382 RepID=UPI0005A50A3F|nr:DUF982 domain-containing protein [Sinorhizobium meliloti]MDE4591130.1 DUF982 domain-containing protein [Sinorhizobium meliloti]
MKNTWREPVQIKERPGITRMVKSVDEALQVIDWWPVTRRWQRSVDILIQAQLGNKTPEEGRKAFVEAAREAKALIGE